MREGDPFIPQIGLQGNPLPLENDTEWSLNGRLLVIMPGISFGADFINIQMVTRLDQGNYTVNSSNVAGFGSDTFTLIVESEERQLLCGFFVVWHTIIIPVTFLPF